ncbi:MAG: nuclear transport factor 2 family protein [Waterburya sp.]
MKRFTTVFLISLGIVSGLTNVVQAQSAANAPAELTEAIAGIETAANQKDINGVIEYYSPNFTNTDGLTPDSLTKALQQMWKNYPRLNYTTTIDSWSNQGDQLVAETTTIIKGVQKRQGRVIRLNSTIKSRQYFQQQKLVKQEILAEQSQLTSGENPPQVQVVAPETVTTGEKYNFDLIVEQPLGDKVLLGAVQEEKTSSNLYLNPTALELEPLPAGGIYKTATAPMLPDSNWLSAILVRGDGMTMITHRVNVIPSGKAEGAKDLSACRQKAEG